MVSGKLNEEDNVREREGKERIWRVKRREGKGVNLFYPQQVS